MTADNWTICPQCKKDKQKAYSKAIDKLAKSYGKIPMGEYEKMKLCIPSPELTGDENETLREDWEIGVDEEGLFFLSYSCSCNKCGFSYKEETDKQLKLKG